MPIVYLDDDVNDVLDGLYKTFKYESNLMQLVHLYEILVRKAYLYLLQSGNVKGTQVNAKQFNLTQGKVSRYVQNMGIDSRCLNSLSEFRHSYVHKGYDFACINLLELLSGENFNSLLAIAEHLGLHLNFEDLKDTITK